MKYEKYSNVYQGQVEKCDIDPTFDYHYSGDELGNRVFIQTRLSLPPTSRGEALLKGGFEG